MTPPNIIFILADDLGWRDLGCYGSPFYETPHLDRLAQQGMRFTDAYAACPVCSPTRASILTGKYPARVGVTDWIDWGKHVHPARGRLIDAPYIDHLPLEEKNLARTLGEHGYQTWHVGKWHLGGEAHYPDRQGFDVNLGGAQNGLPIGGYFSPWKTPGLENADVPEGTHIDDYLTDGAVRLIEQRNPARPFFLNVWPYLVHTPIQGKQHQIDKYNAKARALGLDKEDPLEEGEHFPCEHKKDKRVVRRRFQSDATYASMVQILDENVGKLMAALEAEGIADNTIIMFTSDNGGLATAEGSPTCNAPLNEGKGWMYEGGTREPLIVYWPGVTEPDSVCTEPVTSPDFYPTLLEMAGLDPLPEQHVDGRSFAPALRGESFERGPIFWHYPHYGNQGGTPGCSMRDGDYKLIEFFEDNRIELYHLRDDIGEENDLAAREPQRAQAMREQLHAWRETVEAKLPQPNPDHPSNEAAAASST
ncbi:MAG: sulfatase [Phycisphaeraceae bacterium]